jgi:hypothetical protein
MLVSVGIGRASVTSIAATDAKAAGARSALYPSLLGGEAAELRYK